MKKPNLLLIVASATISLLSAPLFASDWDSLGSSEAILQKAKALDGNSKVRVVQKRAVDRDLRFEVSGHYGMINGGDSYVRTNSGGAQLEFHINPQWSLGLRYDTYLTQLTSEGDKVAAEASAAIANGNQSTVPDIDYPLNSQLATISWYPIYGKLNLFDMAVTQFDLYLVAGAGSVLLESGNRSVLTTIGGGAGLWFSQHTMARWELRYQGYKDAVYAADPQVNTMAMHFSLGFLL